MKVYQIKNALHSTKKPVKVLHETIHLLLHRPVNYPLDSRIRTYIITYKNGQGPLGISDYMLDMYLESIPKLRQVMAGLENDFDLTRSIDELSKDIEFKNVIRKGYSKYFTE